jgi:hypothetical protein
MKSSITLLFLTLLCLLGLTKKVESHPGRINSSGCHNDRKAGGYHCHDDSNSGGSNYSPSFPSNGNRNNPRNYNNQPSYNSPSDSFYKKYCNTRYGFCAEYPAILEMEPAPANGDGRKFYFPDGFSITIYGKNNFFGENIQEQMKSQAKYFDVITYQYISKNWFVLSGYQGNNILYIKTYAGNGSTNVLFIQYPAEIKSQYDAIVSRISKSFKPGRINVAN